MGVTSVATELGDLFVNQDMYGGFSAAKADLSINLGEGINQRGKRETIV